MNRHTRTGFGLAAALLFSAGALVACGDDDDATAPAEDTAGMNAGGDDDDDTAGMNAGGDDDDDTAGMNAGAPSFTSFDVSASVPCENGNAKATMSFSSVNVESIAIKIGLGDFEETAGYGPTESDVVVSIPCSGAADTTVQLRGCTSDGTCAETNELSVAITS